MMSIFSSVSIEIEDVYANEIKVCSICNLKRKCTFDVLERYVCNVCICVSKQSFLIALFYV